MNKIVIEFRQDDNEFKEALTNFFPNDYELLEHKGLDGGLENFVAVITIIGVTLYCIEFFLTYLAKPRNKGRVIITPKGKISIEGISGDEIKQILDSICKEYRNGH